MATSERTKIPAPAPDEGRRRTAGHDVLRPPRHPRPRRGRAPRAAVLAPAAGGIGRLERGRGRLSDPGRHDDLRVRRGAERAGAHALGVTFDPDGNVWISNTGQSRVEQYTSDGTYVRTVGADGPGKLYSPYGLAVDAEHRRVYVADYGGGAIQVFTTEGGYVTHFPADDQDIEVFGPDGFSPFDINVAGGRDRRQQRRALLLRRDRPRRRPVGLHPQGRERPRRGARHVQLPGRVRCRPGERTPLRRRLAQPSDRGDGPTGQVAVGLGAAGLEGQDPRVLAASPRIAVGADGNIYVVDTFRYDAEGMGTGHIVVLSPDGELLSEFGRTGTEDGSFRFPSSSSRDRTGSGRSPIARTTAW